ncbi:MAG: lactoylglutathione lyase [Pseudomonadota bacterium]|nr:lactoylglutathione lyase [Pseudoalteromonas sp.]MCP4529138.1 lactoylglutathione lyase [Aestuariibacter sp.]MCP4946596.1 lactoylglutathione lyase [Aestuariibacter sp.]
MKNAKQVVQFLHVMLRVSDLEQSLAFYTGLFGLEILRQIDYPDGQFTLAFLGFEKESISTVIELTYNWNESKYDKGNAFGHLAFAVTDIHQFCHSLKQMDVKITREPGPMKFDDREIIAFIEDPDGYNIELIEAT